MTPEQIDQGARAYARHFGKPAPVPCPCCGGFGHSVWSCEVQNERDREYFARAFDTISGMEPQL
jgi:hypothetical protein